MHKYITKSVVWDAAWIMVVFAVTVYFIYSFGKPWSMEQALEMGYQKIPVNAPIRGFNEKVSGDGRFISLSDGVAVYFSVDCPLVALDDDVRLSTRSYPYSPALRKYYSLTTLFRYKGGEWYISKERQHQVSKENAIRHIKSCLPVVQKELDSYMAKKRYAQHAREKAAKSWEKKRE